MFGRSARSHASDSGCGIAGLRLQVEPVFLYRMYIREERAPDHSILRHYLTKRTVPTALHARFATTVARPMHQMFTDRPLLA